MKYTLILSLSCIPLVVLTAWSFVDAVQDTTPPLANPASPVRAQVAELVKASGALARDAVQRADRDIAVARQLADANLWDAQPGNIAPSATDELATVVFALRQSVQGRQLVDRFAPVADRLAKIQSLPEDSPEQRRKKAEAARQELADFRKEHRPAFVENAAGEPVKGASALFELLDRRAADYAAQISALELSLRASDALDAARQLLAAKKYVQCRAMLDADPLNKVRDESTRAAVNVLRRQAQYGIDRQALDARRATGSGDRALLASTDEFLSQYDRAPIPGEEGPHEELKRLRAKLEVDLLTAELKNVRDFDLLLSNANHIVTLPAATEQHKTAVRRAVADWLLTQGLPRKEPPSDLVGKQEAWTKNGQRLLGYFHIPEGVEQWRYWKDAKGFANRQPALGEQQIPRGSFEEEPAVPKYVQWATTYNTGSARLIEQGGTKEQWQSFIRWCEQADEKLVAYRNRRGVGIENEPDRSCSTWSFRDQAALAQKLIDRWDLYQKVIVR